MCEPSDLQRVLGLRKMYRKIAGCSVSEEKIWKYSADLSAAKVWEDDYADKIKDAQKSVPDSVPLYDSYICGILVPWNYIRDLYECFRVQFLVSYADEHYDICRFYRVCNC